MGETTCIAVLFYFTVYMVFFGSPLEQFEIHPLFSISWDHTILAVTNETLFFGLVSAFLVGSYHFAFLDQRVVPLR